MKRIVFFLFFSFTCIGLLASDLTLTIQAQPLKAIVGEPILLTISIAGGGDFTLPWRLSRCDLGHTAWSVTDEKGNRASVSIDQPPCPQVRHTAYDSKAMVKYNGFATTSWNVFLLPGKYTIKAEYHSKGPFLDRYSDTDQRPVSGIWTGDLVSNEVSLEVLRPSGEDLLALRRLGMDNVSPESLSSIPTLLYGDQAELLKNMPTSTYAAYVVWQVSGAQGLARREPKGYVEDIAKGWSLELLEIISVPMDVIGGKQIGGEIHGKTVIAWREKWVGVVIKAHPDIWFADELRLRTAVDQLIQRNYSAAEADLKALADNPKSPMAEKARQYLGLMREKGWTREPSEGRAKGARQGGAGSGGAS